LTHPGRDCDKLTEDHHARPEVILLECRVGVATQGCRGLGHCAGIAFDLRFELYCRFVERALLEWFFGGVRGRRDGRKGNGQKRGGKSGANGAEHSKRPPEGSDRSKHDFEFPMVSTAWRLAMLAISMPRRCRN